MKVSRHSSQCQVFKPYVITINVNTPHDEGILRTITARDHVIPQFLIDSGAYLFKGVTQRELHDLLSALDGAITGGKECN